MSLKSLTIAAFLTCFPAIAQAESEECRTTCEAYRDCAGGALQAIYDGVFSGSGCSGYETCESVVMECRAEAGSCESECEDGVGD